MASLNAFLKPVKVENKEVIVSDRFQEDGKPVPFIIRPITQEENQELLKKHTKKNKKTGEETMDRVAYNHDLAATAVVFPPLENAELQKANGTLGAAKTLAAMLYIGEFAILFAEVQKISGLDVDINDEIEEAKN